MKFLCNTRVTVQTFCIYDNHGEQNLSGAGLKPTCSGSWHQECYNLSKKKIFLKGGEVVTESHWPWEQFSVVLPALFLPGQVGSVLLPFSSVHTPVSAAVTPVKPALIGQLHRCSQWNHWHKQRDSYTLKWRKLENKTNINNKLLIGYQLRILLIFSS